MLQSTDVHMLKRTYDRDKCEHINAQLGADVCVGCGRPPKLPTGPASEAACILPGRAKTQLGSFLGDSGGVGWSEIGPHIVDQVTKGAAELRSEAPLHTTASCHCPGVAAHRQHADGGVREERVNKWMLVSRSLLLL